jgi:hypothetical protein
MTVRMNAGSGVEQSLHGVEPGRAAVSLRSLRGSRDQLLAQGVRGEQGAAQAKLSRPLDSRPTLFQTTKAYFLLYLYCFQHYYAFYCIKQVIQDLS